MRGLGGVSGGLGGVSGGLGAYLCDDGSTPDSAECADGTVAVFYSDTTGIAQNSLVLPATSGMSTTTLIILGIVGYMLFKGLK